MIDDTIWQLIGTGLCESVYMTIVSTLFAYAIGLPLGIAVVVTEKNGLLEKRALNSVLNVIINITRSIPFLILLIAIIPFTRLVAGTSIGMNATVVPLVVAAAPFVARLVESSIKEVNSGVIEAAKSLGATPFQIIWKVLIPESKPSLILGAAIATTTILSYSAMAGIVGGGGLGDIAIRYGYYRYEPLTMMITVILLVVLVQVFQEIGNKITKKQDKRKAG
ncbi:MAG: methionine ABC transporter permease [Eubacteriales bacterium]